MKTMRTQADVTIIDYGVGNLYSLKSSFATVGASVEVIGDPSKILKSKRLVLPGVGAFGDAMCSLKERGLAQAIVEAANSGIPLLGICLGMQLLFDVSFEYGKHEGLGLISGQIRPISDVIALNATSSNAASSGAADPSAISSSTVASNATSSNLKIPHIGWNALHFKQKGCPLFQNTKEGDHVYFVHSYFAGDCDKSTVATTEYGAELTAAVADNNVYGCQFHPEKSGAIGLEIIRAFCKEVKPS